jgi:uncharacterized protein
LNFERLVHAVVLVLLAAATGGCATGAREAAQLRTTMVDCRIAEDASAAVPRSVRLSARDCADGGGDYTSADTLADFKLWLPLAKDGDAAAQTRIGMHYEQGVAGIAADHNTAAIWYRKAVRQEHTPAMLRLAVLLEQGLGLRADPDAARALLRRASRGELSALPAPRLYLVEPPVLLSAPADVATLFVATLDRPEGPLAVTGRVTAVAERPRTVQVNEQSVKVDGEGYFRTTVNLPREGTVLRLKARDGGGRSTEIEVRLSPGRGGSGAPAPAAAPARPGGSGGGGGELHALLIANQDYRHIEKLDTPLHDARDLKLILERRYGYQATLLANATRREVLAALAVLRAKLSANDELLVFYAGHGEVDAVTQRAYWIPVDGRRGDSSAWLSTVDVADQLQAIAARRVLLVVDSCFAGVLNRRALRGGDVDIAAASLRSGPGGAGTDKRTRLALSSGGLEPVSDGAGGRNSLYAATLIGVLGTATRPLTAEQLHGEVAARFLWQAQPLNLTQRPHFGPVRLAGHEAGDYTLVPRRP